MKPAFMENGRFKPGKELLTSNQQFNLHLEPFGNGDQKANVQMSWVFVVSTVKFGSFLLQDGLACERSRISGCRRLKMDKL